MVSKCVNMIVGLDIKTMTPIKHQPSLLMFSVKRLEQVSQPSSLVFWQGLIGRQKSEKALQKKKKRCWWHKKTGEANRSRASYSTWLIIGAYLAFYGGKNWTILGELSVINLAISDLLLQKLLLIFPNCYLRYLYKLIEVWYIAG